MRKLLLAVVGFAVVSSVGACGLRGQLERPVPMWGDPPIEGPNDPRILKQEEERRAAEEKAREDARRAQTPATPATPPPSP